jgi:DNA-binding XRE family transcriptional regulator
MNLSLGKLITLLRSRLGESQEEFADRIGVSPTTIVFWENEQKTPRRTRRLQLWDLAKQEGLLNEDELKMLEDAYND